MHSRSIPATATLALTLAIALPAQAREAQASLYLDVSTHAMPGMPGMGAMGRLAGALGGADSGGSYGMARHPGMPGKYLDVALHNRRQPGTPASQSVPRGLGVGERIDLLAPARSNQQDDHDAGPGITGRQEDGQYRIRYYWGCGEQVRAGQPAEFSVTIRDGKVVARGRQMQPRQVPANGIIPGPDYVLWPNPDARKPVNAKSTLVGNHHVTGNALPGSMHFELGQEQDFLPELKPRQEGDADQGMTLYWDGVEGARAYFAHASAADGDTIVMWSSSEDGYAGQELFDYLPESLVAQWVNRRTLLGAGARDCRIPREVFANTGKSGPMVQMIAYGSERTFAEPRPDNAPRDWQPAWNVRVRNKSTAMLMPGGASPQEAVKEGAREGARNSAKDAAKGLLRGLLRR